MTLTDPYRQDRTQGSTRWVGVRGNEGKTWARHFVVVWWAGAEEAAEEAQNWPL